MSIGGYGGILPSAAGTQLAQTGGTERDRVQQEANSQARKTDSQIKLEKAASIGETDGDNHETEDRDADGRQAWQRQGRGGGSDGETEETPHVKDPHGESGGLLDLSG